MPRKARWRSALIALFIGLLGLVLSPHVDARQVISAQTTPQHKIVSVSGIRQSGPYGTLVDITLDIPSDATSDAIAQDALARSGAQPVTATGATHQVALPTLRWPQFFHNPHAVVPQYYNPAGDTVPGGATQALQSSEQAWTNVHTSTFALQFAGTTTLGADASDRLNVVSWPTIWTYGPFVLDETLVTFQPDTGFILDADIVINKNFQYFANPADLTPASYDIRYVLLHENGHVAGLGHSANPTAVMFPFFTSGMVGHGLTDPDIDAISALYPPGSSTQLQHQLQAFNAAYAGSIAFTSSTSLAYTASGSGPYLGQSRLQGTVFVLSGAGGCLGRGFNTEHSDTLTAASGSSLSVLVSDVSCETAPGSNVFHGVGTYTIIDGTGQFIDATGQGTTDDNADLNTGAFSMTFSATRP